MNKRLIGSALFITLVSFLTLLGMAQVLLSSSNSSSSPIVQASQVAGAGFSIILSTLLVILYSQQKELLSEQIDLEERSKQADVYQLADEFGKENRIHFVLSNRGGGQAENFNLVVKISSDLSPESTFKFKLSKYRGGNSDEYVLSSDGKEDFFTELKPPMSRCSSNKSWIYKSLIKNLINDGRVNISLYVEYDDFINKSKRVRGSERNVSFVVQDINPDHSDQYLDHQLDNSLEGNLSRLMKRKEIWSDLLRYTEEIASE